MKYGFDNFMPKDGEEEMSSDKKARKEILEEIIDMLLKKEGTLPEEEGEMEEKMSEGGGEEMMEEVASEESPEQLDEDLAAERKAFFQPEKMAPKKAAMFIMSTDTKKMPAAPSKKRK